MRALRHKEKGLWGVWGGEKSEKHIPLATPPLAASRNVA